jgi:cell division protein FtsW (lipid II flippase)
LSTDGGGEASWFLGDEETDFITVTVAEEDGEVLIGLARMMAN